MKQYKAVPAVNFSVEKGNIQAAFDAYAETINREARGGWEYHSGDTITVTDNPGCLQQPVTRSYYLMIFVREV